MKIMEELEKKPQLAGSSRDLRELLISAMYASEKDPTARHMKVNGVHLRVMSGRSTGRI